MDAAPIRMMIGENAMQVYGLDAAKLREVADRIGPTTAEVSEPLASIPEGHLGFGFRTNGKWS